MGVRLDPDDITKALSYALIEMRIDDPAFEAFETRVVSDGVAEVTLRGVAPDFVRSPCKCSDDEDDDLCDPCIEVEERQFDEPDYLTVVVKIETATLS